MKISVYRRQRAARLSWEWHSYGGVRYFTIGAAHPRKHAWWATRIYIYLP